MPRPPISNRREASATNAKVTANRNRELAKQSLVSRMQLDDSQALERSSAAQVSAAARSSRRRAST